MKRLSLSILTGALLGVLCIIGVGSRLGFAGNELFLFATWFNRVILGLVIGLAGGIKLTKSKANVYLRGALFGLVIGGAFYLSSGLRDIIGFGAAIVYGIIIDAVASKYGK